MLLTKLAASILLAVACTSAAAANPAVSMLPATPPAATFPVKLVSAYYGESAQAFSRGKYLNVGYDARPGLSFCVVIGARKLDLGPRWAQQSEQCATANEAGRATIAVNVPHSFISESLLLLTVVLANNDVHTDALKVAKFIR